MVHVLISPCVVVGSIVDLRSDSRIATCGLGGIAPTLHRGIVNKITNRACFNVLFAISWLSLIKLVIMKTNQQLLGQNNLKFIYILTLLGRGLQHRSVFKPMVSICIGGKVSYACSTLLFFCISVNKLNNLYDDYWQKLVSHFKNKVAKLFNLSLLRFSNQ